MSGVAGVLAIAECITALSAAHGATERTVQFVLFNDEENGLVGSRAYARQLRAAGAQIAGVFQMDMIGFNQADPRTWEIHVGFAGDRSAFPAFGGLDKTGRAACLALIAGTTNIRPPGGRSCG